MKLETLQEEMIIAMKAGDKLRKEVLSGLVGAVQKAAIDNMTKDNITESLVDEVILKEKKTIKEMIDTCPKHRTDLLEQYEQKMAIVNEYAPALMEDESEIANIAKALIEESGLELKKSNRGPIMRIVVAYFKGKAEMSIVNKVIGSLLQ